jgi:hypothetical protein
MGLPTTFCAYDGCGFRRTSLSHVAETNLKKTKLDNNTSPAAGINTVFAAVGFFPLIVCRPINFQSAVDYLNWELSPRTKPNSIFVESMS